MALRLLGVQGTATAGAVPKSYVDARVPQVTVGTTAPTSPTAGDIWIDTN